jgi:hypothetical protein
MAFLLVEDRIVGDKINVIRGFMFIIMSVEVVHVGPFEF